MTGGVLCDTPDCGVFDTRAQATWNHVIFDEDGAVVREIKAHQCATCARRFSEQLGLLAPKQTSE